MKVNYWLSTAWVAIHFNHWKEEEVSFCAFTSALDFKGEKENYHHSASTVAFWLAKASELYYDGYRRSERKIEYWLENCSHAVLTSSRGCRQERLAAVAWLLSTQTHKHTSCKTFFASLQNFLVRNWRETKGSAQYSVK